MSARFEGIAEQYLAIVSRGPSEWMARCPFCDGSSSFQFNVEKGLWNCFRCDDGGGAKSLVKRLGGQWVDQDISVENLRKQFDRMRTHHKKKNQEDESSDVLPESTLLRYAGPTHDYWRERRFTEETVRKWDLGYDPVLDRCTIPYRTPEGDLLGVIQRRLDDVRPRYIYPQEFDRLGHIFGSWFVDPEESKTIALVEGSTDTIKVDQSGRKAGGQYGSSISLRQVRLLRQLGIQRLILFYDYDEAGMKATEETQKKADSFLLAKVVWDKEKYCWHEKVCGCGQHTWRTIAFCEEKHRCNCGRQHNMDPGKLSNKEIRRMYDSPVRIGSRRNEKWATRRSVSSRRVRGRHSVV